ncbi:MAG: hypothetical protein MK066_06895, partial [Crocinitomicaceae bacterium]|nr:hypothetical protein [Crocinitomicaceae bacterium]
MKIFSDISIWWLIPWGILSIVLSIWYYRKQKELDDLNRLYRTGLMVLRASSIFLLGVVLLGLLFQAKEYKTQRPVLITMIDNSSSMLNYKDSNTIKSSINKLTSEIDNEFAEKYDLVNLIVGDGVKYKNADFNDQLSNLDEGFEHIYTQYYNQNIGGICFISDGNFNAGKNPAYSAEKIDLTPIFSVGVGDTIQKKDQLIRNVSTNDLAFYKNQFPIEIDLEAVKMKGTSSNISIWKDGKEIAKKTLSFDQNIDFKHVGFVLEADQIGFARYVVKLSPQENESSYENNEWSFYVEIIDSRSKVLILSSSPHPDVAAIKNVIEKDDNTEVVSSLVSEWEGNLNEYELLIWHEPGNEKTSEIFEQVKKTRTPVWYLLGNRSSRIRVQDLNIGLKLPQSGRLDEAQASLRKGFQLFEISDDLKQAISYWPPLNVPFGKIKNGGGDILMNQRIGPVEKSDPIFYYGTNSAGKYGVTIGEGLWKWKVNEYSRTKEHKAFNELVQKTVQYLVLKKNTDALHINMPRKFSINDDVIINAEFYNSSFEKIIKPTISFDLL